MLPSWIGQPYCVLYSDYREESFALEEAQRSVEGSKGLTRKILSELSARGLLISRRGRYYLPNFDKFCLGIKLSQECKGLDLEERLKKADEMGEDYLVTGSYAAFLYHGYQFPVKHEIRVHQSDYGFWFNFLDEASIEPTLAREQMINSNKVGELKVLAPERLVAELLEDGSTSSILDAVSVLISQNIQWEKLVGIARDRGLKKEIGAILESLENELEKEGKRLVPKNITAELFASTGRTGRFETYPKDLLIEDDTFSEVGEKWRLKFSLSREAIRKPIEDIALAKA